MLVQNLIALIETTAPPRLAASWDKSGVQVASAAEDIRVMCVALDPEPETVRQAVDHGAQFVLCHHPLTLSPRLPDRLDGYHDVLSRTMKNGLWLYSAHTSLDANPDGPVNWFGHALGLQNMRILEVTRRETPVLVRVPKPGPENNMPGMRMRADGDFLEYEVWPEDLPRFRNADRAGQPAHEMPLSFPSRKFGFGCIGHLPEPLTWEEFERAVSALLPCGWRSIGSPPDRISTVAYCPGSGADLAGPAFTLGAQVYLSGDLKYHQAQAIRSLGLTLDVGHFQLEEGMMRVWSEDLAARLAGDVRVVFLPGRDPFA